MKTFGRILLALCASGCAGTPNMSGVKTIRQPGQAPHVRTAAIASGAKMRGVNAAEAGATVLNLLFALQDSPESFGQDMRGFMSDVEMLRSDPFQTDLSTAPPKKELFHETAQRESGGVPLGLSAGFSRTRIWTHLRTSFQSAAPSLNWDDTPKIVGNGAELSLLLFGRPHEEVAPLFGEGVLKLGCFEESRTAREAASNGFYVRERVRSKGYWADSALRVYLLKPLFLSVGAGVFFYRLKTEIDTNLPSYSYDGLSGDRVFGMLGFGGGVRTSWKFPLKVLLEGMLFLTSDQEPILESAAGQLSASLAYYF